MLRSFGSAVSGLQSAQTGLGVAGHNMANVTTPGYTRQQSLQSDFGYQRVGANGFGTLQVGLGTDVTMIRQIRNTYLDALYRSDVSVATYNSVLYKTGNKMENSFGELYSTYNTHSVIGNIWSSLHDLVTHPGGIETRSGFIATASSYLKKMTSTYESMLNEQQNLNNEVIQTVDDINDLIQTIHSLNEKITMAEASGQRANDFRDQRNYALDNLAQLINIEYYEKANGEVNVLTSGKELIVNGNINKIGLRYTQNGSNLVEPVITHKDYILPYDSTYQNALPLFNYVGSAESSGYSGYLYGLIISRGLYETSYDSDGPQFDNFDINKYNSNITGNGFYFDVDLSDPSVQNLMTALNLTANDLTYPGAGPDPTAFPNGIYDPAYISAYDTYLADLQIYANNMGALLDYAAGSGQESVFGSNAEFKEIYESFTIFKNELAVHEIDFDMFQEKTKHFLDNQQFIRFNAQQCTIPNAIMELDKLFNHVVTLINDCLSTGYDLNGDKSGTKVFLTKDGSSNYTISNTKMNEIFDSSTGYNRLCLSSNPGETENAQKVEELIKAWNEPGNKIWGKNINDAYRHIVDNVAERANTALANYNSASASVENTEAKRQAIMGVSLDEEMSNMLKYQHAYNASSRMINVLDSMIDKLINGTGRVGL